MKSLEIKIFNMHMYLQYRKKANMATKIARVALK